MFIDSEIENHTVSILCHVMSVSRSGYYAWRMRKPSDHEIEDEHLKATILEVYRENRSVYGTERILEALRRKGIRTSRRRCSRLMRELSITGVSKRKKKPKTTITCPNDRHASDLVQRSFTAREPNKVWFADITYVKTHEGWLYLAVVFDIFSRIIVGWSMSQSLAAELVDDALMMGITRRRPAKGLIHHSDKGVQYTSLLLSKTLVKHGIRPSMGGTASPWDNAATESLISTIKAECTDVKLYGSIKEAKLDIFEYIEVFYNRLRFHSALGMMSPKEYEDAYYRQMAMAS